MSIQNAIAIPAAFDATGLNVHSGITDFGRTKSLSFRMFAGAHRHYKIPSRSPDARRFKRALRKLRAMRAA